MTGPETEKTLPFCSSSSSLCCFFEGAIIAVVGFYSGDMWCRESFELRASSFDGGGSSEGLAGSGNGKSYLVVWAKRVGLRRDLIALWVVCVAIRCNRGGRGLSCGLRPSMQLQKCEYGVGGLEEVRAINAGFN
jgi:hypothetical protein